MKKLGIALFIVFIFVAGVYAVFQSEIGRNYVRNTIASELKDSGIDVQIERVEGTLPHQIDLKGLTIRGDGIDVFVVEVKLRPVLWRLLSRELAFTDIHAKGISVAQGTPFDFDGKFRINPKRAVLNGEVSDWKIEGRLDRKSRLTLFSAKNPLLNAKGRASFNSDYRLTNANIQIGSDQLLSKLPFSAAGRFLANVIVTHDESVYKGRITWQIPNLIAEETKIGSVKGKGDASWEAGRLKGEFIAEPLAKVSLDLEIRSGLLLVGNTILNIENLQSLHIPNAYGKLKANAKWEVADQTQILHLDATATDFYYGKVFAQKASLYSDLKDPFNKISGLVDFQMEKAKWHDLQLETATLETKSGEENWVFSFFAEGKWKHPLEVHMAGTWKDHFVADIQNFNGTFFNHPFELAAPVRFEATKDRFLLRDMEVGIAGASAFFHIDRKGDNTDARVRFDRLPLDFLSLNPLDVSVKGIINLQANVKERNNKLQGDLKAAVEQVEVTTLGINEKVNAAGRFEGSFNRDQLKVKGNLLVNEKPILNLNLSLPIHFSIWPFDATVLNHKNARGEITLNGRVEDFLDFFDLGPHRLEGQANCKLRFTNTLYRPLVEGNLTFQNGFYQNYYTGTELRNISADFLAEKNKIFLRSLTAQDPAGTGTLQATGEAQLLQADRYPFSIDAVFQNLKFVEIDLVNAVADGRIRIEGNSLSAIAKGDVQILKADLSIPDHIPRPMPDLQVVYRNPIHPIPPPETKDYTPYPLYLDLHVTAPADVTISGRGLSSEWRGDFKLGGTYTSLAAKGKLELIDGKFEFSSRSFKLSDGSLSLSGVEHEMPYLNLAGSTETKGITITARLKGPLDDPQITLQSVPPLPLGSIMSYLLFGQDLSEIGGFQALQLASSLASLAGTGPDVMESTRRSLGIDRLRVITDPTEEGGETVALQVGKYVSKGVLVTFTQGTEESSTNISVEVELKDNFVFQVESDQHQEQGKFTLKWNLNY